MSNHTDASQSAMVKLHMINHRVYLRANQIFKPYGLTVQQALILDYLFSSSQEKINQKDIESFLGISNPSVTSLMKTMVAKRLVRRLPDRTDARSYLLQATSQAQELKEPVQNALEQIKSEFRGSLTDVELAQFMELLEKIDRSFR